MPDLRISDQASLCFLRCVDPGKPRPMPNLLYRDLPKWPQMLVTGNPVTTDQAKEIIRRTDMFLISGYGNNDTLWNRDLASRLRMPHFRDWSKWTSPRYEDVYKWHTRWGSIQTEYVKNDWISAVFVHGPHGWCHPDGTISYVDNVGKWPSVEEVRDEWLLLSREFPFLDLAATLMDAESCTVTRNPVVTILVKGEKVTLVEGSLEHHREYPSVKQCDVDDIDWENFFSGNFQREHGVIPVKWYDEWAGMASKLMEDL